MLCFVRGIKNTPTYALAKHACFSNHISVHLERFHKPYASSKKVNIHKVTTLNQTRINTQEKAKNSFQLPVI